MSKFVKIIYVYCIAWEEVENICLYKESLLAYCWEFGVYHRILRLETISTKQKTNYKKSNIFIVVNKISHTTNILGCF